MLLIKEMGGSTLGFTVATVKVMHQAFFAAKFVLFMGELLF